MKSYAIADRDALPDEGRFLSTISEVVEAGVDYIQLRAKGLEGAALMRLGERCREIVSSATVFLVNGRADVAAACGADGVHLPSTGLPVEAVRAISTGLIAGRSCHNLADVARATGEGADYVLLGPVFSPRSKSSAAKISLGDLRTAAGQIPTFALGGIALENVRELRGLGLAGIAAITMFMIDRPLGPVVSAVRSM